MLSLKDLEICFKIAERENYQFVGVKIKMYGFDECEIIINPKENFEKKLVYYQHAYTEDLKLKNAPDKIEIVGFTHGNDYNDIENDLMK